MSGLKDSLKSIWERLPFAAELEWRLIRRGKFTTQGRLRKLHAAMETWHEQAAPLAEKAEGGKKVLLFGMIQIWIRYAAGLGMAFAGMGHDVTLAYLPYSDWFVEDNDHQMRLRNLQLKAALAPGAPLLKTVPLMDVKPSDDLPNELFGKVEAVSVRDFQYTRQVEEVDKNDRFFDLRRERNLSAAAAVYQLLTDDRPDVVLVPNGLILEFGAVYEVARYLDIEVVTYEFGEQHDRIWLAQNKPVMFQDTEAMWGACKNEPFTEVMREKIGEMYASRHQAGLWQNFSRQWQDAPTEGAEIVREKLGLDDRPVILLAANVIGDSLTLGRQVFSESMTEFVERTLRYFEGREDVQFILRVHPGERYTDGPSVGDIVQTMLPEVPPHIRIIAAQDPVNTYDLLSVASLGLTYTTTVGMEMAMYGVPPIVVGRTHYRGKGFTYDPDSWDAYFELLDQAASNPGEMKLSQVQVEMAWHYAYSFFFHYPQPFPWHLRRFWPDMEACPITSVLSDQGMAEYGEVFAMLLAEQPDWLC